MYQTYPTLHSCHVSQVTKSWRSLRTDLIQAWEIIGPSWTHTKSRTGSESEWKMSNYVEFTHPYVESLCHPFKRSLCPFAGCLLTTWTRHPNVLFWLALTLTCTRFLTLMHCCQMFPEEKTAVPKAERQSLTSHAITDMMVVEATGKPGGRNVTKSLSFDVVRKRFPWLP